MSTLEIRDVNARQKGLEAKEIEALAAQVRGQILGKSDTGYDEARRVWNAMIDRQPALIVRCRGVTDVMRSVEFAREHQLLVAVRGGGHNIAGSAVCDGGLMIDLSLMNTVTIDPGARLAHVGPGATLGDFDHEAQAFGLSTPLGINSTTGVAGLTLGGGFGWLSRKYGMTIDQLTAADVVTADGKFVRASQSENADLFWAIRGGGGNFGIVTRFEFRLHPVGPDLLSGLVVYSLEDAPRALRSYREYVKNLGEDTNVWVVMRKAPPLPFLPEKYHGTEVIAFAVLHAGDPAEGRKALEPVRNFGKILGEHVGVQPFTAWQAAFDPLLVPGARNYWKSHNFAELKDEAIDAAIHFAGNLPSDQCEIFLALLGGAAERVAPDAMAYAHRDAKFVLNVHGRWDRASEDQKCIAWAREFFDQTAPYATGGVYVNFMTDDEDSRVSSAYGGNYEKLVALKKKYDPKNLFRLNQNIRPGK